MHNYILWIIFSMVFSLQFSILTSCSKGDSEEWDDDNGENTQEQVAEAPSNVAGKTFKVNRQSFEVHFMSNNKCTITDPIASSVGDIVVGTPTYQYNKVSKTKATLNVSFTSKMYIGSDYSMTTCNYTYNLDFSSNNAGYTDFSYKWVIKMTVFGKLETTTKNGSSGNSFTLK